MPRDVLPKFIPEPRVYSSAETEQRYPHAVRLIARSYVGFYERGLLNDTAANLRHHHFNRIETFHFITVDAAAEMAELIASQCLDRLSRNSTQGSNRGDVAAEWRRIAEEREGILQWGRTTGMTGQVVAHYRAERHLGSCSYGAHVAAARLLAERAKVSIHDPMNHAGVMIEWAEREHRAWFWRCCRDGHYL
jgi:plasmid stabilization system protein ParE